MMKSRRRLFVDLIAFAVPGGILALAPDAQAHPSRPQNPPQPKEDETTNLTRPDPKLILEANQKEIKKYVEKLYALASELKAEVEKTDSARVLSLAMVRKAEEIERLAKEIKSRAKG